MLIATLLAVSLAAAPHPHLPPSLAISFSLSPPLTLPLPPSPSLAAPACRRLAYCRLADRLAHRHLADVNDKAMKLYNSFSLARDLLSEWAKVNIRFLPQVSAEEKGWVLVASADAFLKNPDGSTLRFKDIEANMRLAPSPRSPVKLGTPNVGTLLGKRSPPAKAVTYLLAIEPFALQYSCTSVQNALS